MLIKYLVENKIDVDIVSIPRPSAVISALSTSGFPTDNFIFLDFVPHKKGGKAEKIKKISPLKKSKVSLW